MLRYIYYMLSFVIPPLAVCSVIIYKSISDISFNDPVPAELTSPELPRHDDNRLTAIILLGNKGTEISDLLIPYELLSETGRFNVYTVANHKILSPLNGGVDILPHYTLDEIDELLPKPPDLIVVPNIPNINAPDDKPLIEWIRNHNKGSTMFLSICEGARTLAETGLLDYKKATTHWSAIGQLRRTYPDTTWIDGEKFVEDGNIVTSPGVVTGSMEGTLHVISRLLDSNISTRISSAFNYMLSETKMINPIKLTLSDTVWFFTALYPWQKDRIGVYMKEGVSEINIAAVLDTYPRSFTATTIVYSDSREIVKTKNNMFLVPKLTKDSIGPIDDSIDLDTMRYNKFVYDATIEDLARRENKAIAATVAKTLDYRIGHLKLEGAGWPYMLLLGPLFLGFMGILCAYFFENRYLNG